jgi:hypothetical protein
MYSSGACASPGAHRRAVPIGGDGAGGGGAAKAHQTGDCISLMGDFNGRLGRTAEAWWEGSQGGHLDPAPAGGVPAVGAADVLQAAATAGRRAGARQRYLQSSWTRRLSGSVARAARGPQPAAMVDHVVMSFRYRSSVEAAYIGRRRRWGA